MPDIKRAVGMEVLVYAKQGCRICTGQGLISRRYDTNWSKPPEVSICGCIVNWLLKHKKKEVEYDARGQLYWREGFSPKDLQVKELILQRERRRREQSEPAEPDVSVQHDDREQHYDPGVPERDAGAAMAGAADDGRGAPDEPQDGRGAGG